MEQAEIEEAVKEYESAMGRYNDSLEGLKKCFRREEESANAEDEDRSETLILKQSKVNDFHHLPKNVKNKLQQLEKKGKSLLPDNLNKDTMLPTHKSLGYYYVLAENSCCEEIKDLCTFHIESLFKTKQRLNDQQKLQRLKLMCHVLYQSALKCVDFNVDNAECLKAIILSLDKVANCVQTAKKVPSSYKLVFWQEMTTLSLDDLLQRAVQLANIKCCEFLCEYFYQTEIGEVLQCPWWISKKTIWKLYRDADTVYKADLQHAKVPPDYKEKMQQIENYLYTTFSKEFEKFVITHKEENHVYNASYMKNISFPEFKECIALVCWNADTQKGCAFRISIKDEVAQFEHFAVWSKDIIKGNIYLLGNDDALKICNQNGLKNLHHTQFSSDKAHNVEFNTSTCEWSKEVIFGIIKRQIKAN